MRKREPILSMDEAVLSVCFTGRPGSGKSTVLRMLMRDLVAQGANVLWTCIKPDEKDEALKVIPDATLFSSQVFNPLTYELSRHGGSALNLATFHDDLNEVLTRADSQRQETFWKGGAQDTLTHAFELAYLVNGHDATYHDVYSIILTSPADLEYATSAAFRETTCGRFINALGSRDPQAAKPFVDLFLKRLPSTGEKARGAFVQQALNSIKPFVHGLIAPLVNGRSTITPEQMLEQHTILDVDTLTYSQGGLAVNLMVSWLCMEAVLRRRGDFPHFALVRDEFHQLASAERDVRAQSVGRSQRFIGVSAFQTIPVLESALGGGMEAQTQAKALYGLYTHKFMMNNPCHHTNELNAMIIGQEKKVFNSISLGGQPEQYAWYDVLGVGARPNVTFSEQWHYRVPPTTFSSLKTGGKENDFIVDAIVHHGTDGFEFRSFKQEF